MQTFRTDIHRLLATRRPSFLNDVLIPYELPSLDAPVIRLRQSVDLRRVVGIWHSDYCGKSWGALLGDPRRGIAPGLKRLDDCLRELQDNPSYYVERREKEDWTFYQVGRELYVSTGNHRTVVARFFLELNDLRPVVHGVTVVTLTRVQWQCAQDEGAAQQWGADLLESSDLFAEGAPV
jgi:hypothetical protein